MIFFLKVFAERELLRIINQEKTLDKTGNSWKE